MADLIINVDVFAGASIPNACRQATHIATMLGAVVKFEFNGVKCFARPNSDWQSLALAWDEVFHKPEKERSTHPTAWSAMPPKFDPPRDPSL